MNSQICSFNNSYYIQIKTLYSNNNFNGLKNVIIQIFNYYLYRVYKRNNGKNKAKIYFYKYLIKENS